MFVHWRRTSFYCSGNGLCDAFLRGKEIFDWFSLVGITSKSTPWTLNCSGQGLYWDRAISLSGSCSSPSQIVAHFLCFSNTDNSTVFLSISYPDIKFPYCFVTVEGTWSFPYTTQEIVLKHNSLPMPCEYMMLIIKALPQKKNASGKYFADFCPFRWSERRLFEIEVNTSHLCISKEEWFVDGVE